MKKSAFITLSACALASLAVIRMKQGLRNIKDTHYALTHRLSKEPNTAGMFV